MPIFELRCDACEVTHEVIVLPGEERPVTCPDCDGTLQRLWSRVGVQLVGWGFARNDALLPSDGPRRPFKEIKDKAAELSD